jgi:hypothetical protein
MEIREGSPSDLEEYARVSIAFEVNRIRELSVHNDGLGGFALLNAHSARPS